MLRSVRKLLRDRSPDWLNTEVNKNLLQNLSASLSKEGWENLEEFNQVISSHIKSEQNEVKRSLTKSDTNKDRPISTDLSLLSRPDGTNGENCLLYPKQGTPHWRRIRQVFQALDNAPANYTYNQLIEYVREATGKGCSRKLIGKWKKYRQNLDLLPPREDRDIVDNNRETNVVSVSSAMTINAAIPSSVNSFQLNQSVDNFSNGDSLNRPTLLPVKTWSYLATAGIMVSLVGCEIIPFNNRPTENIAIASVTAPITPLTPIPERRKNRLEPRTIKIELTLSNPQDLKVKPGDKISAGQVLSDRVSELNRLQAKKKQLQLSLEKLNLPLTPIPQPKPIPEISPLPPVSYAEEEAAIKLKQQKLTESERAIARAQKKIDSLTQLQASPSHRSKGGGDIKLVIEHEQANLKSLEAARQSAQIQLEVAQSKLTTAKEQRAYLEYQRQLEQTRRAIAIEQRNQAIASQESKRSRLLAEREYSQAQIETQIQTLDYQIHQLSTVTAPYEGTIKKVKWTGQSDHNLTAVVTLAVKNNGSTIANGTGKPTPNTEIKQTTQTQP